MRTPPLCFYSPRLSPRVRSNSKTVGEVRELPCGQECAAGPLTAPLNELSMCPPGGPPGPVAMVTALGQDVSYAKEVFFFLFVSRKAGRGQETEEGVLIRDR